jgi:GAF domain-containing protein
VTRDGRTLDVWVTLTALVDDANVPVAVAATEHDITERNRATERLLFANRALKALNRWHQTCLNLTDPDAQIVEACRTLVEESGYSAAWVGRIGENPARTIIPLHWAGVAKDKVGPARTALALAKLAREPIESALASGHPVAVRHSPTGPENQALRADAPKLPYGSFLVLPLILEDIPLGVLVIDALEPGAFEAQEVETLADLAENMARTLGSIWKRLGTPG